jgi:hypothetical protein
LALLAGLLVFWLLGGFDRDADPDPSGPARVAGVSTRGPGLREAARCAAA